MSILEDLQRTDAYPAAAAMTEIEPIQTHVSMVFVGPSVVYKVKKEVDFGFLDYSTLEKRKHYCEQEVALNSPRAPEVYFGVVPIRKNEDGRHVVGTLDDALDGPEIVEYAVKMRRIDDALLLKNQFKAGTVTDAQFTAIAERLAAIHHSSTRSATIDEFGRVETIKFNADENFEQTADYVGRSITAEQYNDLKDWTASFFAEQKPLLERRIEQGRIRDCHGDLHMEHIVLTDPIAVIDCIEFNERFRYSDTAADIGFLLMDLEFNDGAREAALVYDAYRAAASEPADDFEAVIQYYKIYRAYVRGKVISFLLDDRNVPADAKAEAEARAQRYFALAHSYLQPASG